MPTPVNQFLPFATGSSPNILTPAQYAALAARLPGFPAGLLPSKNLNTPLRQSSFVASAIAEFIRVTSGVDVLDDGNSAAFLALFEAALSTFIGNAISQPSWTDPITSIGAVNSTTAENLVNERAIAIGGLHPNDVVRIPILANIPSGATVGRKYLRFCVDADPTHSLLQTFEANEVGMVAFTVDLCVNAAAPHIMRSAVKFNDANWADQRDSVTVNLGTTAINLQTKAWVDNSADQIVIDAIFPQLIRAGL